MKAAEHGTVDAADAADDGGRENRQHQVAAHDRRDLVAHAVKDARDRAKPAADDPDGCDHAASG